MKCPNGLNMTNVTNESTAYSVPYKTSKTIIYGILSVLVIGGNSLCLVVLKRYNNHLKTPTRLFLTSLTCADLLSGLCYIFPLFVMYALEGVLPWDVTRCICQGTRITIILFGFVSVMSLLSVNLDRYLAIEYPLKCETIVTALRARIAISCMWTIGLVTSLTTYFTLLRETDHMPNSEVCDAFYYSDTLTIADLVMLSCISVILPFTLLVMIYARILVIANRHKKTEEKFRAPAGASIGGPRTRVANHKALNTFLLVTLVSCCTWIPLCILSIFNSVHNGSLVNSLIDVIVQSIWLCTYWINILIYTCRDRSFRKGAIQLFTR